MPDLKSYLDYNNPNVAVIRSGVPGDEYVLRQDFLPVVDGIITLLEIPSDRHGVQIEGFTEIDQSYYENKKKLLENEFLVYYPSGIIMFHPIQEGKSFAPKYQGRGAILLSSDRVYMMYQKNPNVLVTLTDFAKEIKDQIKIVNSRIKRYEQVAEYTLLAAEKARVAADQANEARDNAILATKEAIEAAESTIMIYQNPVFEYEDLNEFYPNPENGFRVMVLTTGDVYRYDAIRTRSWQIIDNITKYLIPVVTEEYDGIMSKEDYRKLMNKPFEFSFSKITQGGIQDNLVQAPYDGYLHRCYAYMNNNQSDNIIEIEVQMIAMDDFILLQAEPEVDEEGNIIERQGWKNIFSTNIKIEPTKSYAEGIIDMPYHTVDKNTLYRINFKQFDNKMGGVTIHFDMWLKEPVVWGDYSLLN